MGRRRVIIILIIIILISSHHPHRRHPHPHHPHHEVNECHLLYFASVKKVECLILPKGFCSIFVNFHAKFLNVFADL